MATFTRFEDIPVWQDSRNLCISIYQSTKREPFNKDYRLCSQITAAAGSIMDNIAEGFEREGIKEFIQFLYIAKGSCGEVRSQLYRAHDVGYLSNEEYESLKKDSETLSAALYNYIAYLKKTDIKG